MGNESAFVILLSRSIKFVFCVEDAATN